MQVQIQGSSIWGPRLRKEGSAKRRESKPGEVCACWTCPAAWPCSSRHSFGCSASSDRHTQKYTILSASQVEMSGCYWGTTKHIVRDGRLLGVFTAGGRTSTCAQLARQAIPPVKVVSGSADCRRHSREVLDTRQFRAGASAI